MTASLSVVLAYDGSAGGTATSVTLTNMGVSIVHRFNNPIVFIPTPALSGQIAGANQIGFNLGFYDNSFDLTFTLMDDLSPGTFTFSASGTNYEKLVYMAADPVVGKQYKTITINSGQAYPCQIEAFRFPWLQGRANLSQDAMISLRLCAPLKM